jgi:ATP phosphoribosyltransferase regulatory subunit
MAHLDAGSAAMRVNNALSADEVEALHDAVKTVFAESDPRLELPREDRWRASLLGKERQYSYDLRQGLATTLGLLGAYGDRTIDGSGLTGREWAAWMVRELLETANADASCLLWASLADVLPLLAEAAPSEFLQAGIESFGRQDRAAADAEMLALALEATSAFGLTDVEIRTGDVALFNALIDALDLYPVWRRRLIKDFNRKVSLTDDIERLTLATAPGRNEYEGVLAALAGSDRKAALALVTDLMSIAGTTNVGGRTVAEIADRFLEQSTLKSGALPRDALATIKRFLAIAGDPDDAVAQLRSLASDTKLNLGAAIDQLESRVGFMAARGIDTRLTRFSTSFGRGLDYYTGFEFELHARGDGIEPLVAGGRYDGLMTQLGATTPIPAVGFSVWIETLTQIGNASGSAS